MSQPPSRWASNQPARPADADSDRGREYAARFAARAASGQDVHGEASFCSALLAPGARVLDAGCGTGRVAIRLASLGYSCVGVDSDESMLAVARAASTDVRWELLDLADAAALPETFDLIVAAGNVMPLVAPGTEAVVVAALAGLLTTHGRLVAGFGLDAAHLPLPAPPFGPEEYDAWCVDAGLVIDARYATWAASAYDGRGYAVSVHRRTSSASQPADTVPV